MAQAASLFVGVIPLTEQLLHLETTDDIEQIIAAHPEAQWRPLGDRENNFSTVHITADPGDALVERVTNGIDALIERAVALQGMTGLATPREASEHLFNIPAGRLANLDTTRRKELAQHLRVTARGSGEARRPTIVVEDHGIGQHPSDFPNTLLSLNQTNKVRRLELMGAFGQGGASIFAFTDYGVFVSRRDPSQLKPEQADRVGWTIVRFNQLDASYRHGRYEYLVLPDADGKLGVPSFDPKSLPEDYRDFVGCHFTAVCYGLDRYYDTAFRPKSSLWQLLNLALFDPIYPILIRDERPAAIKANPKNALDGFVASGNATRLAEDKRDNIDYDNAHSDQLQDRSQSQDYGRITVRYFILKDAGDKKKNWERINNYVPPDLPVTITLNGQRQGTMRRDTFAKLGLLSMSNALIVQVDCDNLSREAKWRLFSATRDRIKDTPIAKELEAAIRRALGSDSRLRALDRERKEKALSRQSASEAKKIQEWLNCEINSLKQGAQEIFRKVISTNTEYQLLDDQPLLDETPADGDGDDTPTPLADASLTDPPAVPTDLRVLNPLVKVPVGGSGVVRLVMDAPDDYISPDRGTGAGAGTLQTKFSKGGDLFRLTGYSAVRRGVIRATISADKGAPVGERGRVIFAVTRPDDIPLFKEADIVAVETRQARAKPAGKKAAGPEAGPDVRAIDREGWLNGLNLSEEIIAQVENDPTKNQVTIYVYKEYPPLMARLRRERVSEENLVNHQSKFVAAMALAAWLQHQEQKEREDPSDQNDLDMELRRAAEVFMFTQSVANEIVTDLGAVDLEAADSEPPDSE